MRPKLILVLSALLLAGALSVRADSPDRGVARFASGSGSILYLAAAVGLPLVTDGTHGRNHALRAVDGIGVTAGITEALKAITREKRPDSDSRDSFPSGHTSAAFAAATLESADHPRQAWLWYTGATVIGWSRLRLNRHHPQDVVAGAVLGYGVARWELGRAHGLIVPGIDRDEWRELRLSQAVPSDQSPHTRDWPPAPLTPRPDNLWGLMTEEARAVIRQSEGEAGRMGADAVTPDALLLSLLSRTGNNACEILRRMHRDPSAIAGELRRVAGSSALQPTPVRRRLAERCVRIVEMAEAEAGLLGHGHIGSEHLLIAIVHEVGSTQVLARRPVQGEYPTRPADGIDGLPRFAGPGGLALDDLRRHALRVHKETTAVRPMSLALRLGLPEAEQEATRAFLFGMACFLAGILTSLFAPHGAFLPFSAAAAYGAYRAAVLGLLRPSVVLLAMVGAHVALCLTA